MAKSCNPLDRAWQNRWRSLTFIGCLVAFLLGLRSPVSQRIGEAPTPLQVARSEQRPARLVTRMEASTQNTSSSLLR